MLPETVGWRISDEETGNALICTLLPGRTVSTLPFRGQFNRTQSPPGSPPNESVRLYETDGPNQSGRPITFGRPFAQGEFQRCLQPVAGGSLVANYQVDVKNRWSDGSVKFAVVSPLVLVGVGLCDDNISAGFFLQ